MELLNDKYDLIDSKARFAPESDTDLVVSKLGENIPKAMFNLKAKAPLLILYLPFSSLGLSGFLLFHSALAGLAVARSAVWS